MVTDSLRQQIQEHIRNGQTKDVILSLIDACREEAGDDRARMRFKVERPTGEVLAESADADCPHVVDRRPIKANRHVERLGHDEQTVLTDPQGDVVIVTRVDDDADRRDLVELADELKRLAERTHV